MTSDADFKTAQQSLWDRMAVGWDRHYALLDRLSAPINGWLCDHAQLAPGKHVLDIASGSGQPAFMAAQRVAPGGSVTATDISGTMVDALKRRAAADGAGNLEAVVADMDALQFDDASFDAVTCRWGFMFSREAARAIGEARRVLRPGGILAAATWDRSAPVPLGTILQQALDRMAGLPPGREPLPTPLDTEESLADAMRQAGFDSPHTEQVTFSFDFDSANQWWEFILEMSTPIRRRIDALNPAELALANELFSTEAEKLRNGNKIVAPAVCVCAWASR